MHGGDIYNNRVKYDHSVNLNPYLADYDRKGKDEYEMRVVQRIISAQLNGLEYGERYPDIDQTRLRSILAGFEGVKPEWVFAGCGASQLIMAAVAAESPTCALLTEPCFTGYMYALNALDHDCHIKHSFLKEEDGYALTEDILDQMTDEVGMMFITDPNNPTGKNVDRDLLLRILARAAKMGIAVVLDESFYPFSEGYEKGRTATLVRKYKNLYVIKSFTKSFALPGIRMGYVVSSKNNIAKLRQQLPEWNLPTLSDYVMRACVSIWDDDLYERSMNLIRDERAFLEDSLQKLGLKTFSSDTAFILFKGPEELYKRLLRRHILIRKCDDMGGTDQAPGEALYRIAVKRLEDNAKLIKAIGQVLEKIRENEAQ